MDMSMFPLLAVALILWFGIFAFMLFVERRVARLEQRVAEARHRQEERVSAR